MTAAETLHAVNLRVREMVDKQNKCWRRQLVPALSANNIQILNVDELSPDDLVWVENFYRAEVRPVLTPLGLDPAHPFPQLLNKSLNIIVQLEIHQEGQIRKRLAVVQVPRVLPRLVRLPRPHPTVQHYVSLGYLIGHYLADLFLGAKILGYWHFRVTRNSELYIDEEEVANLLKAVENELHNRRRGEAVRLEIEYGCPKEISSQLLQNLHLGPDDLYEINGPVNPTRLMARKMFCARQNANLQMSFGKSHRMLKDAREIAVVACVLRLSSTGFILNKVRNKSLAEE